MVTTVIKQLLPGYVKHPALSTVRWYYQMRGLPAQSKTDRSIFKDVLLKLDNPEIRVFEWGSGASTVYYAEFLRGQGLKFEWHAQDNSQAWWGKVQERIAKARLSEQVSIYCSEFPAFFELPGYTYETPVPPEEYTNSAIATEYVHRPKDLGGQFDVLFIDGRFRRRCLRVAAEVVSDNGIVILHDSDRDHYLSALDIYPKVQFLETGMVPGISQTSNVALAGLKSSNLFAEISEKYRDFWPSGKQG